jgi:hypothetical protein
MRHVSRHTSPFFTLGYSLCADLKHVIHVTTVTIDPIKVKVAEEYWGSEEECLIEDLGNELEQQNLDVEE